MKYLKVFAIMSILGLGILGMVYQYISIEPLKADHQLIADQTAAVAQEISTYEAQLGSLAINTASSNVDLVQKVLDTDLLKLVSATALAKDATGEYKSVVTVQDIDEVAFFTNTLSAIAISAKYEDFDEVCNYISALEYPYSAVYFDKTLNMVTIRLVPVTMGTSEIDSDITTTPEATETENVTPDTEIVLPEGSTDMDIQYLGGDEDGN